jgi:hypothetical protein
MVRARGLEPLILEEGNALEKVTYGPLRGRRVYHFRHARIGVK